MAKGSVAHFRSRDAISVRCFTGPLSVNRGRGSPISAAMPPKKAARGKPWHAVEVATAVCIKGGLMRQSMSVEVVSFDFQNQAVRSVAVSSAMEWLCRMAAGKPPSARPLARCGVFKELHRKLVQSLPSAESAGEPEDKMEALGFDEPEEDAVVGPVVVPKRPPRLSTSVTPLINRVTMKDCPSAVADSRHVVVAVLKKTLYVQIEALSWLANYLREELQTGGVPPVEHNLGAAVAASGVYWDFRDEAWVTRPQKSGDRSRRSMSVRRRMEKDLKDMDFATAKQIVYDEFTRQLAEQDNAESADAGGSVHDQGA